MHTNYNIRKEFLGATSAYKDQGVFNPALDEPTYLTFKLDFFSDGLTTEYSHLYDSIPQGLFCIGDQNGPQVIGLDSRNALDVWKPNLTNASDFIKSFYKDKLVKSGFYKDRAYSALEYLYSRNEDYRCWLLANFLKGWNDLQNKYQYYFQEVDGLDELFKSEPDKGQKISKSHTITIKCLEGIDQKVKYLLSLYKAAAWDDHYQRWILPDIYRYFKLNIYISEIRTFHQSVYAQPIDGSASLSGIGYTWRGSLGKAIDRFVGNITDKITGKVFSTLDDWTQGGVNMNRDQDTQVLAVVKGFVPVTCIQCSLCDFDINHNTYRGSYNIDNNEMETTTIKVRVRQAEVMHNWQIIEPFRNLLNKNDRTIGQKSLQDIVQIGDYADQYFNDSLFLPSGDLSKDYTGTISQGWIIDGINNIVDSVTNPDNNILDVAYDGWQTVRHAIADKKAMKGQYLKFTAANGEIGEDGYLKDKDGDTMGRKSFSKAIEKEKDNPYSAYGGGFGASKGTLVFNALEQDGQLSYIVAVANNFEKQGLISVSQDRDKSKATNLDNPDERLQWTDNEKSHMMHLGSGNDRSKATDLDGLDVPNMTRESQESIMDKILSGDLRYKDLLSPMTYVEQFKEGENFTSLATDSVEASKRLVDIGDLKSSIQEETDVTLTGISDPASVSLATDLGNNSDAWKLEARSQMTSIEDASMDRSIATDLDEKPSDRMQGVKQPERGSRATKITEDTIKSLQDTMTHPSQSVATETLDDEDLRSLQVSLTTQENSLATAEIDDDQEKALVKIQILDDKSMSTDLDNDSAWPGIMFSSMQAVINPNEDSLATSLGLDERHVSTLTSLSSDLDRSLATDLDGDPEEMRPLPESLIVDRSTATNLDNLNKWSTDQFKLMTSTQDEDMDRSLATDLDNTFIWPTQRRTEMIWIPQGKDGSLATSFDNLADWEEKARTVMEMIKELNDRSISTNLDNDWYWDGTHQDYMSWIIQGDDRSAATDLDNGLNWNEEHHQKMTDLTHIQIPEDKSVATDLDNLPDWKPKAESTMIDVSQGARQGNVEVYPGSMSTLALLDETGKNIQSIQDSQALPQDDSKARDSMTWVPQETESLFDKIASMQNVSQETSKRRQEQIDLELVETKSYKDNAILEEDLFTKIASSVNSSKEEIALVDTHKDIDRSLATDLDEEPTLSDVRLKEPVEREHEILMPDGSINPETPVRELVEVYLEYKEGKKAELQEVTLVSNENTKKTIL